MLQQGSVRRLGVVATCLGLVVALLPQSVGAQEPNPADIVIEFDVSAGLPTDQTELIFTNVGNCVADEIRIPFTELADGTARRQIYERISRTPGCTVELTNVPAGWRVVEPFTNPADLGAYRTVIDGAADEMLWRIERIPPTHTATLRVDMVLQATGPAGIQAAAPDVRWRCTDGTAVDVPIGTFLFNADGRVISNPQDGVVGAEITHEMLVGAGATCTGSFNDLEGWAPPASNGPIRIGDGETGVLRLAVRQVEEAPFVCAGRPATIVSTRWDDEVVGTSGPDVIYADDGNDIVRGGGGADIICGGDGNDQLWGNAGKDRLLGGAGNDILRGGRGADVLAGGAGNDVADGARHNDRCKAEFTRRCEVS